MNATDHRAASTAINAATGQPGLPRHPDLQRLLRYWGDCCHGRPFPRRADIDPCDLGFMLNRIGLTEVHESDPRPIEKRPASTDASTAAGNRFFRFRVVGSWWRDISGLELTNLWADELPNPKVTEITVSFYQLLLAARRPHFISRDAWIEQRRFDYQILILPLSEDGERISMIVTGIGPGSI